MANEQWLGSSYLQAQPYQQSAGFAQPQMRSPSFQTNKRFCVSLEDALARPVDFNTCILWLNQNNNEIYEITTDMNGYKSSKVGTVTMKEPEAPQGYVSKADYDALKERVDKLTQVLKAQRQQKSTTEEAK